MPFDTSVFAYRYALIIGNEDYTQRQPLLTRESNVIYAKNDALTFKKYAVNTLGIPEKNVFLLLNATYAERCAK